MTTTSTSYPYQRKVAFPLTHHTQIPIERRQNSGLRWNGLFALLPLVTVGSIAAAQNTTTTTSISTPTFSSTTSLTIPPQNAPLPDIYVLIIAMGAIVVLGVCQCLIILMRHQVLPLDL